MGKNSRCVIGICNNDNKHPQHYVKHSDVKGDMIMPALPKVKTKMDLSAANLNQKDISSNCFVCSHCFLDRQPTRSNRSPSLFLTINTNIVPRPKPRKSPHKQKTLPQKNKKCKKKEVLFCWNFSTGPNDIDTIEPGLGEINVDKTLTGNECDDEQSLQKFFEANAALLIRMLFAHITRESDVSTGTEGPEIFKVIFEIVKPKAWVMTKKRH